MQQFNDLVLDIARQERDAGAGEVGENNAGPWIEMYVGDMAEPPVNWCCAFVCWCIMQGVIVSYKGDIPKWIPEETLSVRNLLNQFREHKKLVEQPQPGDIIFFWREDPKSWLGHVGIIEKVTGMEIITIEGNKGKFPSKVQNYKYTNWQTIPNLLGFGRL